MFRHDCGERGKLRATTQVWPREWLMMVLFDPHFNQKKGVDNLKSGVLLLSRPVSRLRRLLQIRMRDRFWVGIRSIKYCAMVCILAWECILAWTGSGRPEAQLGCSPVRRYSRLLCPVCYAPSVLSTSVMEGKGVQKKPHRIYEETPSRDPIAAALQAFQKLGTTLV